MVGLMSDWVSDAKIHIRVEMVVVHTYAWLMVVLDQVVMAIHKGSSFGHVEADSCNKS